MSVPYRLFVSKLMPTDGWEHPEQPVTDSPLIISITRLYNMSRFLETRGGWGKKGT